MNILQEKLLGRLQTIVDNSNAVLGVAVKDLTSGEELEINGDEVFPAASTIKVAILLEFFRRVDEGNLNPNTPITYLSSHKTGGSGVLKMMSVGSVTMLLVDYATLMITVSDNAATNIIIDILTIKKINQNLEALGLKVTRLTRKMLDMEADRAGCKLLTTPLEMSSLMDSLYRHEKMTPKACEETLKMLQFPKEGLIQGIIRNSVPDKVSVANKSGWINGATCDVGITYQPGRPYIVTIFAKNIPVKDMHMFKTISELTEATGLIQNYFEDASSST
jgi:beta-lactamase class A